VTNYPQFYIDPILMYCYNLVSTLYCWRLL